MPDDYQIYIALLGLSKTNIGLSFANKTTILLEKDKK
jgi:hypothetical protein